MAASTAHATNAGTLVLAQPHAQQHGTPSTSTTAHPTISDAVTLRLVPRRKKKVCVRQVLQTSCKCKYFKLRDGNRYGVHLSVKWAHDVAEINENSGKRKSKKCCIFHRRRRFGDWSDEDDSDMDCDCDAEQQSDAVDAQQQQQQQQQQPVAGL